VAALAALLAVPCAGSAAQRKVPFGFFGTVLPNVFSDDSQVSAGALDTQMALMARSGVESARVPLPWPEVEVAPEVYDWRRSDRLVGAAARHGISLLVNVLLTPNWASSQPRAEKPYIYPPQDPGRFASLMDRLVRRYGPAGSYWAENPAIPRVPVRSWQIWNEQMTPWMWGPRPWAESYVSLLRTGYRAIHRADHGAKVVAGSLVAYHRETQWSAMSDLYRAGAKGLFDVIAVHPFTNEPRSVRRTIDNTLLILKRVRKRMRARGQPRLPIILSELTWPASVGKVPPDKLLGLETTRAGQAKRLRAAYAGLARARPKLRITQAYWYSWATEWDANSTGSDVTFRFSGLNRYSNGAFSPLPLLDAYSAVAARYQGCRKGEDARVCR
jgi:hypothetical protein